MKENKKILVIGCGVLGPEIKHLATVLSLDVEMKFLPGGLHNTPDLLRTRLQEGIDIASRDETFERIVVGYGLCGKGTLAIQARNIPLVFPRVHDCIALFLGSDQAYQQQFDMYPGTFYISEGWRQQKEEQEKSGDKQVWVGSHTLGCDQLRQQYGRDGGDAIIDFFNSWKGNYQRAAFINTGVGKAKKSEQFARDMAKENNWDFASIPGSMSLLTKLLTVTESDQEILFVPPFNQTTFSAIYKGLDSAPLHKDINDNSGPRKIVFEDDAVNDLNIGTGLGVDAGGTYTDVVLYDFGEQEIIEKSKALTTKWDFSLGISDALAGLDRKTLEQVELISVSTTLATNAIVEGEGQHTGLILMDEEGGNNLIDHVPKRYIQGRLKISGKEVMPVDVEEVRQVVQEMQQREGVTAFAVSGFAGAINPAHELLVKEIIEEETGAFVCCGHEFSTQLNFIVRAQTAVLNARIIPRMMMFFKELDLVLTDLGIEVPVLVVKGDGTLMAKSVAMKRPVETILSGPAASVAGARHLTGLDNALVVDIGGTTTDSADIVNGEVDVCDQGAAVGGFSTHVRALDMTTVGLGGDSLIRLNDTTFTLGPRRVGPLVWAEHVVDGGIQSALLTMATRSLTRQEQVVLIALDTDFPFAPTIEEEQIYHVLKRKPLTPEVLAHELGKHSHDFLVLQRLEESGLVQRCGLTPTDLLHVMGSFVPWDATPARNMIQLLVKATKKPWQKLVHELLEQVTRKVSLELIKNQLFADFERTELDKTPVYHHVANAIVENEKTRCNLQLEFEHPIIGIGAPTHFFLPEAGKAFNAEVIIPENADVANAIGAITSHILVQQSLRIRPVSSGFLVEGVVGNPNFSQIDVAEQWAVDFLKKQVVQKARQAGTSNSSVTIDINDQLAPLRDGTSLFLERVLVASLKGSPDLVLQTT